MDHYATALDLQALDAAAGKERKARLSDTLPTLRRPESQQHLYAA